MGKKFSQQKVIGALGPQQLPWNDWEEALRKWCQTHTIKWEDVGYAEILAYFINQALRNHYGSYEAQALLNYLSDCRICSVTEEITFILDRLNQLNVFEDVYQATATAFAYKLARFTTCAMPWWRWSSKGFRLSSHSLDGLNEEIECHLALDKQFLLKV